MSLSPPSTPGDVSDITNGLSDTHINCSGGSNHTDDAKLDTVDALRAELGRVRAEKDTLAGQYGNLVQKLNAMRTSVANKLQQDAEELDRREQLAQSLNTENEELQSTIETLKSELVVANDEAARAESELDAYRAQVRASEGAEGALHEAHAELERARIERDEWARLSEQERALRESARDAADLLRRELENEREARMRANADFEAERERAVNLQSVLEDFQNAKAHEIRQAVKDYQTRLEQATLSLAEFKHRAHTAEMKLEESSTDSTKTAELEKTAKEKDALVIKLRHEAVILNDHLNEALRRLRRTAMDRDTAVDRRLVTNILLSFLNAPRGDAKRFEMLKVLSDILGWGETEREKAGLQRAGGLSRAPSKASTDGLEKTDETESFSQMWVEFLLTQAEGSEGGSLPPPSPTRSTTMSSAGSPRRSLASLGPSPMAEPRKSGSWIRLPSFGGSVTTREDTASPIASAKGKEKEVS